MRTRKLLKTRFMILLSVAMVMSVAAIAVAQASTPIATSGNFVSTLGSFSVDKVAGQNLFYNLSTVIEFTGTLSGTGEIVETGVEHGGGEGPIVAHGVIHFAGTIGDSDPGTIDIQYNRTQDGGFASAVEYEGDRVFLSHTGTGGLANLHGTAHFVGAPGLVSVGTYAGQFHFD